MPEIPTTQFRVAYRVPANPGLGLVEFDYGTQAASMREALQELETTRGALPAGAIVVLCELTGRQQFTREGIRGPV